MEKPRSLIKFWNKRKIVKIIFLICLIVFFIHVIHAVTFDRIIEYKKIKFYSPDIPTEMNGYKIAFISDVHYMTEKDLNGIVEELNNRQIDLFILGGDMYYDRYDGEPWRTIEILSQVETSDGIFGVEGNHDNYRNLFKAMEEYSVIPLSNNGVYIRDNFYLAGVEDLWNRKPNINKAIENSHSDDFVLLISHNPDIAMQQDTDGVDLILSGHTHGGQITFFGIWSPYFTFRKTITDYGQRFSSGWCLSKDGTSVFVSNGAVVQYFSIPRIFARPQVVIITLFQN